jgi:hypothetical protein
MLVCAICIPASTSRDPAGYVLFVRLIVRAETCVTPFFFQQRNREPIHEGYQHAPRRKCACAHEQTFADQDQITPLIMGLRT